MEKRIRGEARKLNLSEEELILNAVYEYLKLDPESRVDIHLSLADKYLKDAEDLIKKEDYVQASEKAWRAIGMMKKRIDGSNWNKIMKEYWNIEANNYDNSHLEIATSGLYVEQRRRDIVLCINSFHYTKNPEMVLNEMNRDLKREGIIY